MIPVAHSEKANEHYGKEATVNFETFEKTLTYLSINLKCLFY